jgi:hypothetical protein
MAVCYYCSGTTRCQGCAGRVVQFDSHTCALCGGLGDCQRCTNGQLYAPVPDARLRRLLALLASSAALAISAPAAAQTSGAAVVFLPNPSLSNAPALCIRIDPITNQPSASQENLITALSADGSIAAGQSFNTDCLVVWRNAVPELLPGPSPRFALTGNSFGTSSISGNGLVLVGHNDEGSPFGRSIYWTGATGAQFFPAIETFTEAQFNAIFSNNFDLFSPNAVAIGDVVRQPYNEAYTNSDGTYFAVNSGYYGSFQSPTEGRTQPIPDGRAYRWSPATGYLELPRPANTYLEVTGIDGSGDRIIGQAILIEASTRPGVGIAFYTAYGFVWNAGTGLTLLPDLSTTFVNPSERFYSRPTAISRDGTSITGVSRDANGIFNPVLWRGTTITALGSIPGRANSATEYFDGTILLPTALSGNGSVIVGAVGEPFATYNGSNIAWRWTETTGIQDLNVVVANAGINLNGFILRDAAGVSDNGQIIAGNAFKQEAGQFLGVGQDLGYVLQLAQITRTQLIVRLTLPGVTLSSIVNQSFSTRVEGTLNGTSLFTRTVADTIDSSLGIAALADARSALQQQTGLRRVVIGAPTLVSNTTTVLSTTNSTVNVPGGSSTSTTTINSFGPGTVITGDLGICATGVIGGTPPTGCTLPGTPVEVGPGILNSNIYTTTQETVTPTTTPTVNQRIDAVWRVAATAGNRFGTAHGLVGPAAFERGDRLLLQMLGQGAEGAPAFDVARADTPIRRGMALGEGAGGGFTMFGGYYTGDSRIDADTANAVAAVRGDREGLVLGLERELGDGRIGVAVDHGSSTYNVRDATLPERLRLRQTQIGLFGGLQSGRLSLAGAASYGFGEARTSVASPTGAALAERDANAWSAGLEGRYAVVQSARATIDLTAGVRHSSVDLSRFTESGGNSPLVGIAGSSDRTRLTAGVAGEFTLGSATSRITPRLYARYAHDSGDVSGSATVAFAAAPNGATFEAIGPSVGRDVAELGASVEIGLNDSVALWGGYDGSFRSGSQSHAVRAGASVRF